MVIKGIDERVTGNAHPPTKIDRIMFSSDSAKTHLSFTSFTASASQDVWNKTNFNEGGSHTNDLKKLYLLQKSERTLSCTIMYLS